MKLDPILSKAAVLAKKHDYDNALKILKAEEDRYYGKFKYFFLYALISLHSGAFLEAITYFRLARQIKMKDKSTMLALAALHLKRLDTVQAVDYYLDVQEIDPNNRIAKKGLAVIRKYSDTEALSDWLTPERLAKLFPPIPAPVFTSRNIIKASLIFCAAAVVSLGVLMAVRVIPPPFQRELRPTDEFILTREVRDAPMEIGGVYSFILSLNEAINTYNRALSLFASHRDEHAKVNLNRILESNASEALKNSARRLFNQMETPGFHTFRRSDNFSLADVRNEPVLYRNVYVIWSGTATNITVTDEYTSFSFLVGFDPRDRRSIFQGEVPVFFNIPIAVNSERPLEVLGRINLGPNLEIRLEGVSIHQSGRL